MSSRKRSRSPQPRGRWDSPSDDTNTEDAKQPRGDSSPPRRGGGASRDESPPRRGNKDDRERRDSRRDDRDRRDDRREDRRDDRREDRREERGGGRRNERREARPDDSPPPGLPESSLYGKPEHREPPPEKPKIQKEKPDFKPSGKLTAAGTDSNAQILKWNEPQEASIPTKKWRLYVFKDDKPLEPYYIHKQSAYLFGRDRNVVDIPLDHPSCSKQHAVLQYRKMEVQNDDGEPFKVVKPYLLDLESTNGSFVNGEKVEAARYYELREKDVLKFGLSTREFVVLHENSV